MKNLRLVSVFSRTNNYSNAMAVRGPKKKKGGAGAGSDAPLTNDIVNIWKDRKDPVIVASDKYPPWLMDLIKPKYMPDDVMF